ncbi:hypothetical protein Tco_0535186 [Tanacetum coccineum]
MTDKDSSAAGSKPMTPFVHTRPANNEQVSSRSNCSCKELQSNYDKMLLMEAKEKGVTLDAEAEAFLANVECTAPYDQPLAMATTNIFEVNHEDA